jgi:predicted GIY-YIG superfamily endonuclease
MIKNIMLGSNKPVTVDPPSKAAQKQIHFCYILVHPTNKTYAGYTVSPARRLRQHNCEISGGARYTSRYQPGWEFLAIITSPQFTKHTGLSFEWSLHHPTNRRKHPKSYNGVDGRLRSLPLVFGNKKFIDLQYQVYVQNPKN